MYNVDVFQTWWGDFNQCYIQNTDINIYFLKIQFNETTIENVNFKNMNFENCQITHTLFRNCKFENCTSNYL